MLYFVRTADNSVVLSSLPVGKEHSYKTSVVCGVEVKTFVPRKVTFAIFAWDKSDPNGQELLTMFQNMERGEQVPGLKLSNRPLVLEDGTETDTVWAVADNEVKKPKVVKVQKADETQTEDAEEAEEEVPF